ncbi:hypothetical protein GMLC_31130 [Geomonas limicola]|uniref:DUF2939 domain-containing protein n=1 Tax=Geomonas limicola TaxID=2740186 RepID=A0A6V8NCC5_9BACT|nr:DUF2939 domain-containing protein [Geomonas limicola]GFO69534.1 hypothetical protein GMLC_31130 [Geomonas limicola]
MKRIATVALIATLAVLGIASYVRHTPHYSLYKFSQALKQHDADTAFQYLDVDQVVDNLVQKTVHEMEAQKAPSFTEQIGNDIAKGLISLVLPTFKEAARSEIRAAIQEPTKSGNRGVFKVFAGSSAWHDFSIERQGKIALVTKKSDKDFLVKLAQEKDGHWKIVQLTSKEFRPAFGK